MSDDEFHDPDPVPVLPVGASSVDEPYPNAPVMPHDGQASTVSHDEVEAAHLAVKRADAAVDLGFAGRPEPEPTPVSDVPVDGPSEPDVSEVVSSDGAA